jgi:hypothetical protein
MSFKEKNVAVTLVSFSLIMGIFLVGVFSMVLSDNFTSSNVFRLWGITVVLAIVFTIIATILTHIVSAIIEAIRTGNEDPEIEDFEDERDKLIDLKGTRVTYAIYSIGVFLAMLTFVFGQPALVMFTLLIFFGVFAQIIGDIARLILYRRGF